MITPIVPGNASATFALNLPSSNAKAFSLVLSHFSHSLAYHCHHLTLHCCTPLPKSKASTGALITIPIAIRMEVIVMNCSLNSVLIFLANEVSLSNTFEVISLIPIIWLVSLPLRRLMLSCLTFSSSFSLLILFLLSSQIPLSYSG